MRKLILIIQYTNVYSIIVKSINMQNILESKKQLYNLVLSNILKYSQLKKQLKSIKIQALVNFICQ